MATSMDGYERIRKALSATALTDIYMEQFERRKLDDNGVNFCIKFSDRKNPPKSLDQLMKNEVHRTKFIEAFKNLQPIQIFETPQFCPIGTTTIMTSQTSQEFINSPRLTLRTKDLKTILAKVGNRPVALFTIVGPSRQGKSFILNYMLKFLRSRSKGGKHAATDDHDWFGKSESNRNKPLQDGFKWKYGMERQTEGIWMWSEPFTLTGKDGQEIDLLLADTEGVFDSNSGKEQWEAITGLTLLTSSCLIFNTMNNIPKESLDTLKPFLDYGQAAIKVKPIDNPTQVNERPFQTLCFLVRDWGNEDEYPYGAKGGGAFLQQKFDIKLSSSATKLRQQIKNSFQQISCFLMPHPGKLVKTRAGYDGSVAGMNQDYAHQLEIFIEQIFHSSTLTPKIVNGNIVTGNNLFLYFEQYAKLFQKLDLPTQDELLEATRSANNQVALKKSFSLYLNEMQPVQETIASTYMLENALLAKHENATHLAIGLFNQLSEAGSEENEIKILRAELKELIVASFQKIYENNSQQNKYRMESALQNLEIQCTELIRVEMSKQANNPEEEEELNNIYRDCFHQARQRFLDTLGLTNLDVLPEEEQDRVAAIFAAVTESARIELKNKEASTAHQPLIVLAKARYEKEIKTLTQNFSGDLVELHEKAVHIALQFVSKTTKMSHDEKQQVKKVLDKMKSKENTSFDLHLNAAKEQYKDEMDILSLHPGHIEESKLFQEHERISVAAIELVRKTKQLSRDQELIIKQDLENLFQSYQEVNSKKKSSSSPAIGIDVGTTFCCLAVFRSPHKPEIIPSELDRNKTASYVAFPSGENGDEDEPYFGLVAMDEAINNPLGTVFDMKRMLGRQFNDPRLQRDMKFWPFEVIEEEGVLKVKTPLASYTPLEITVELLKHLKKQADNFLNAEVISAVVTVPAYFNILQRELMKEACKLAGLNVLQLINEPTAAAVAYSMHKVKEGQSTRNCVIFDFGGGTLDVAVLTISSNQIQVKAVGGDDHLGGQDIDNNMMEYCLDEFKKKHCVDLKTRSQFGSKEEKIKISNRFRRLKKECEKHKCFLSQFHVAVVSLESMYNDISLNVKISRNTFEVLNKYLFERCIEIMKKVLESSKVDKMDIDEIVMVGGSCRIPLVQEMVSQFFGGKQLCNSIDVDEAVAVGAALLAFQAQSVEIPNILVYETEEMALH